MGAESFLTHFVFSIGYLNITLSILTTWFIMMMLFIFAWAATRKLSFQAGGLQVVLEGIISVMHDAVEDVLPQHVELVFPFIATLWIFILVSNLIGIIPGFYSPTADLSVTSALAIMTFISVHWFGIRTELRINCCAAVILCVRYINVMLSTQ